MDSAASATVFAEAEAGFERPGAESDYRDLPMVDPGRQRPRYRPLKAWHHFRNLVADKENTGEVFKIFEALPWRGLFPSAEAFLTSGPGQKLREREPYLPAIFDDHAALRRMPKGSLAHAYCDFMEAEGLTAAGLVEEFERFMKERGEFRDQFGWYMNRIRDTHDILHVLTGYGRDALGEQCVLAFSYSQQPAPAHLFIAYAGGREIKREVKSGAPVFSAIREGQRLGKACPRLAEQSILDLLPLPVDEARALLNITPPSHYHECHRIWREAGIDPYDLLKPKRLAKAA
jgi:ubiquinone biosynthesis protein COQ4